MKLAQKLINKPVFSIAGGRELGKVEDLFLDATLKHITAIYLGSNGILNRSNSIIRQSDIITLGEDAILVQDDDCVLEEAETPELSEWLERWKRRDDLRGREMNTPGGTKIGRLGDIILDEEANIAGFSLSQTFVTGPVAENKAVSRSAMIEPDDIQDDGAITIELAEAERANLRVEYDSLFSSVPTVSPAEETVETEETEETKTYA